MAGRCGYQLHPRASLRLHSNLLYQKFLNNESSATASRTRRKPRKKNTPCISDLAGGEFFLKKERVFFFRGSALQVFGQCGGAKCENARAKMGLGRNPPLAPSVFFWRNSGRTKTENTNSILCLVSFVIASGSSSPRSPSSAFASDISARATRA